MVTAVGAPARQTPGLMRPPETPGLRCPSCRWVFLTPASQRSAELTWRERVRWGERKNTRSSMPRARTAPCGSSRGPGPAVASRGARLCAHRPDGPPAVPHSSLDAARRAATVQPLFLTFGIFLVFYFILSPTCLFSSLLLKAPHMDPLFPIDALQPTPAPR